MTENQTTTERKRFYWLKLHEDFFRQKEIKKLRMIAGGDTYVFYTLLNSKPMEIKSKFDHFNINVTNLERSIAFYEKALGLKEHHRKESSDGSFTLVYLTDGNTGFLLELTCLKDHPQAYELGENESHLCFRVSGDYDAIRQYHKENGWVCFENTAMGLYFINDPDDYWIEVLPEK